MQLKTSNMFILLVLVSSVSCETEYEWREVGVGLWRTVGSAMTAAEHLGVKYISMLEAYERTDTGSTNPHYWVAFIAESMEEVVRCEAHVEWMFAPPGGRIVRYSKCTPDRQQGYMY